MQHPYIARLHAFIDRVPTTDHHIIQHLTVDVLHAVQTGNLHKADEAFTWMEGWIDQRIREHWQPGSMRRYLS